ncbi:MAG: hypothetical protein WCP73_04620 [Eubacteriales bacterium]
MSLHIGGKREVGDKKILFILDYDQAKVNPDTCVFIKNSSSVLESTEITQIKSIVVTEAEGKIELFYSPISSVTLAGRCKYDWTE